jgi:hypothetical protein
VFVAGRRVMSAREDCVLHGDAAAALRQVQGQVCWAPKLGHGSFLTLEFGRPVSVVRPAIEVAATASPRVAAILGRAAVHTHGEWHLWIYACHWAIRRADSDHDVASSDRTDAPDLPEVLSSLARWPLSAITVNPDDASTGFEFGEPSKLVLRTWPKVAWPLAEQWLLYAPDGTVLTVRESGQFSLGPADQAHDEWRALRTTANDRSGS